jgi:stage IV sporulation protein B
MKKIISIIMIGLVVLSSQMHIISDAYNNNSVFVFESTVNFDDYQNGDVEAVEAGKLDLKIKKLNYNNEKYVFLGGKTVGIAVYTDGLYVNDVVAIENEVGEYKIPGNDAGIKKGDYIISANGIKMSDISNIDAILKNSNGSKIDLVIVRNDKEIRTGIVPVKSKNDGQYRLGLKMRDSAAGLGTVTFIDPETNTYAALGHSINDSETGEMLKLRDGRIVDCIVTGVKKGERNKAGELKGTFGVNALQLGTVAKNDKFGLSGSIIDLSLDNKVLLGNKYDIKEGNAYIYSDFEDGTVRKYSIQIVKINNQTYPCEKSMVIRVTDPRLIEKTGGIVQGMSGSPIVQDDKLVGAVTHVLVDDPTKGYGIFIENMLETLQSVAQEQLKDAS